MNPQKPSRSIYIMVLAISAWIFFMSGLFATSNDVLKPFLKDIFDLNQQQSSLAHFAFFVAYFFMAIPGGRLASRLGYRKAIPLGTFITVLGTAMGIGASVWGIFELYLVAIFVMASGVAVIVVMINAYVAQVGDPKAAASRLNLVNAFYGLGAILGPTLGGRILMEEGVQPQTIDSLTLYILFASLALATLIATLFLRFPELDVRKQSVAQIFGTLRHKPLRFGVLAMFIYVGAEVSVGSLMVDYLVDAWKISKENAAPFVSIYWGSFMVLRLAAAPLGHRVSARQLLRLSVFLSLILIVFVITGTGTLSGYMALGLGVGHALMFPAIYALSVNGLGDRTQDAGSLVMMAAVGGAVISQIHGLLADMVGLHLSYVLSLCCYIYLLWFSYEGSKQPSSH
ncbi:MAG: MFS transporter [Bacteroidota bacterium]